MRAVLFARDFLFSQGILLALLSAACTASTSSGTDIEKGDVFAARARCVGLDDINYDVTYTNSFVIVNTIEGPDGENAGILFSQEQNYLIYRMKNDSIVSVYDDETAPIVSLYKAEGSSLELLSRRQCAITNRRKTSK